MKNIISNSNENVKCPMYHSSKVYKFGKYSKTGNQKYQCQVCKHQTTFLNPVNKELKNILVVLCVVLPLICIS